MDKRLLADFQLFFSKHGVSMIDKKLNFGCPCITIRTNKNIFIFIDSAQIIRDIDCILLLLNQVIQIKNDLLSKLNPSKLKKSYEDANSIIVDELKILLFKKTEVLCQNHIAESSKMKKPANGK